MNWKRGEHNFEIYETKLDNFRVDATNASLSNESSEQEGG